ncbi:MAG: DUF4422 domain-containing protein [Lachnospiraceae bacterium]|nr:DUF4422 domain-containing protein [Lachnospiraceae bacterium]
MGKNKTSEKINIAVTVNDNYVYPLKIMLHTLFHSNRDIRAQVYLIYSDVSRENLENLRKLCTSFQSGFFPVKIGEEYFRDAPCMLHLSKEMYYRILIADFVPDTLERILYLDPDMLVLGDIRPLYHVEMDGKFFAGAQDRLQDGQRKKKNPEIRTTYINSGVLVCNLACLRKEQNRQEVFDFLVENRERLQFPDQDLINELYEERLVYVKDRYNLNPNIPYAREFFYSNFFPFLWPEEERPVCLHYMGSDKPWNPGYNLSRYQYYWLAEMRYSDRNKLKIFLRGVKIPGSIVSEALIFVGAVKNRIRKRIGRLPGKMETDGSANGLGRSGEMKHTIEVYVATHKKVELKLPDYCRLIQVGSALHDRMDGYLHDDEWEPHISDKNESYCELTALYFLWKHSEAEIKGLFQYRRLFYNGKPLSCNRCFITEKAGQIAETCLTESQIREYLNEYDIIDEIPFTPGLITAKAALERCCYPEDIEKLDRVICEYYPEYYETFKRVMGLRNLSYCNMLIAKRETFDAYCEWLFGVLARCEALISVSSYDIAHKRVFGFFGEILMDVWIRQQELKEKHVPRLRVLEYSTNKTGFGRIFFCVKSELLQALARRNIRVPVEHTRILDAYWENSTNT